MSRVADFLQIYPSYDDAHFQRNIASLKEFADLKLESTEPKPKPGEYFDFQTLLARFLSPHTPYDGMLFYLEIGVGKTCTSIAVHEIMKRFYTIDNPAIIFSKTLVLAKGDVLLGNYKNEFLNVCPGLGKGLDINAQRQILRENFEFHTLQKFANNIVGKNTPKALKEKYSNRLIVIDEGQDLKKHTSKKGEANIYKSMQKFFDAVENCTKIIMSGEPIVENPDEPVGLVNLLVPPEKRLPLGKKFMDKFYDGNKLINVKELEEFFRGHVSYVRQMGSVASKRFMTSGKGKKWLKELDVYECCMSDFQKKVYYESAKKVTTRQAKETLIKEIDGKKIEVTQVKRTKEGETVEIISAKGGSFYQFTRESSMFVYPDGTYGGEGFRKHIEKKGAKGSVTYSIPKEWKKKEYFGSIENLRKYSCKYADMIEIILKNPNRLFYIYSDLVHNSGLILFGLILELYNFAQTRFPLSEASEKRNRYVSIHSKNVSSKQAHRLLQNASQPFNARAEYIRVILGSEMVSYGVTIKNATGVGILTPQWNWPTTQQIYGRTVRPGSDEFLKELGLSTTVDIYLMCAVDCESNEPTTDVHLYQIAEDKKLQNEPMSDLLKRSAADCPLMYRRNVLNKSENYTCAEMKPTGKDKNGVYLYDIKDIDPTNYNLFYAHDDMQLIINEITKHFTKEYTMPVRDDTLFLLAVQQMIDERIPVTNPLGSISYIKENNKVLYLQNILTDEDDPSELYYVRKPLMPYNTSLESIIETYLLKEGEKSMQEFCDESNVSKAKDIFNRMNRYTKIVCFEAAYSALHGKRAAKGVEKKKAQAIVDEYDTRFDVVDDVAYHALYAEKITGTSYNVSVKRLTETGLMRGFIDDKWTFVSLKVEEEINRKLKKVERKAMVVENEYGMYGTLSSKDNKFRIVLKGGKGLVCKSYDVSDLFDILLTLDEFPDADEVIKKLNKEEVKDRLLHHTKLTNKTVIQQIKDDKVPVKRMKEYLSILNIKNRDQWCDEIQKIMRKKDILYDI